MAISANDLVAAFEAAGYDTQDKVQSMLDKATLTLSSQAKKQAAIAARAAGNTARTQAEATASALEQSAAADEVTLQQLIAAEQAEQTP